MLGPVHRREQRAAPLALGDDDAQHGAAVLALDFGEIGRRDADRLGVGGVDLDERLADMAPSAAASSPVRVIVCHWSRMRPVLRMSG